MGSFGERLRRLVLELGLSAPRLAAAAGVTKPTVYAIMDGHEPRAATREAIERALLEIAATIRAEGLAAEPHPGIAALLEDTELCAAHGVTDPGAIVITVDGVPVTITRKEHALMVLLGLRGE